MLWRRAPLLFRRNCFRRWRQIAECGEKLFFLCLPSTHFQVRLYGFAAALVSDCARLAFHPTTFHFRRVLSHVRASARRWKRRDFPEQRTASVRIPPP